MAVRLESHPGDLEPGPGGALLDVRDLGTTFHTRHGAVEAVDDVSLRLAAARDRALALLADVAPEPGRRRIVEHGPAEALFLEGIEAVEVNLRRGRARAEAVRVGAGSGCASRPAGRTRQGDA